MGSDCIMIIAYIFILQRKLMEKEEVIQKLIFFTSEKHF